MRWSSKTPKPQPSIGDTRKRYSFALFPRRVKENYTDNSRIIWVWLETYCIHEKFENCKIYIEGVKEPIPAVGWRVVNRYAIP